MRHTPPQEFDRVIRIVKVIVQHYERRIHGLNLILIDNGYSPEFSRIEE
jgi:hypothetical protein